MDLAFFVTNFGYTKAEYDALTPTEAAFIKKAWESKFVRDIGYINSAVINALYNANRGKKSFRKFWKKVVRVNVEEMKETLDNVRKAEKKKGFAWFEKITGKKVRRKEEGHGRSDTGI